MAENIDININARDNASRTFDNLNNKVNKLNENFSKFRTVLASVGFVSLAAGAIRYADAISDVSDATGIAVENILQFNKAILASGGDAENANNALLKFTQTIGEAADGSGNLQNSFRQVGITLNDLQTLSEQDLLSKTVKGLAGISDKATQARLKTELFGKAFKNVGIDQLAANFGSITIETIRYTEAIKSASQIQDTLDKTISTFKNELLVALQPLSEFAKLINENQKAVANFFQILFGAGIGALLAASFTLIGKGLMFVISAIRLGITAAASLGVTITGLIKALSNPLTRGNIIKNLELLPGIGSKIKVIFEALGGSVAWLKNNFLLLASGVGAAIGAVKAFFNIQDDTGPLAQQADIRKIDNKLLEESVAKLREVKDAQEKLRDEVNKTSQSLAIQFDQQLETLALETRLVNQSEEQQEILRATADLYRTQDNLINGLLEKRKEWAKGTELQKENLGIIDSEIAKIKELTRVQVENIEVYITRLQSAKLLEEDRKKQIENITTALESQISRQQQLDSLLQSANDKLRETQFIGQQQGRTPLQQQLISIQEEARKAAQEAGRAFANTFEGTELTAQQTQELIKGLDLIAQKYKEIADAQTQNLRDSRAWEIGWRDAFNNYMDNATNAARIAGDAFSTITSNMERAIDNFVETGKLSFSDLARSIIQDLIKIELKSQAVTAFQALKTFIGGFFAEGGNPPINKPSIVGEKGPEIFVPRTAGTIIPNHAIQGNGSGAMMNAPVTNNYITNNISALDARSVAQLFAENRKTLLGTVRMAEKEMPYSNR